MRRQSQLIRINKIEFLLFMIYEKSLISCAISSKMSREIQSIECKINVRGTIWEDKYISFALRNKRINHKSIIHRSGNSNQSHGVAHDEYVTRNCSHRYSAGNVSMRAEMHLLLKTCDTYIFFNFKKLQEDRM